MARLFNGTSDQLDSASTIDLSAFSKLAISLWFWWDAFANDDKSIFLVNETNYILIRPNWNGGAFLVGHSGNVGPSQKSFTRPSAAAWHHFAMNIDITKSTNEVDTVYIDGASQTLTTQGDANNTNTFVSSSNHRWMWHTALFAAGRLAEMAFWGGGLLSSGDATNLNNGTMLPNDSKLSIGAATHYWKDCGRDSPELPTLGGVNLTVTGTTQTAHPPKVSPSCDSAIAATNLSLGATDMIGLQYV